MTEKIPISGGPHTGKTTLIDALRVRFPDAHFVPEPATNVIKRERAAQAHDSSYQPRVPWADYTEFGPLVVAESELLERLIPGDATVAFQDRSLIDTIAYSRLNRFDRFIPEVRHKIALAQYSFALVCQPVGNYAATDVRRETVVEAIQTHAAIEQAYRESGLDVIEVPAVSIEQRIELISDVLHERGLV